MNKELLELQQKASQLLAQARTIHEENYKRAEAENREITADEEQSYKRAFDDYTKALNEFQTAKTRADQESQIRAEEERLRETPNPLQPGSNGEQQRTESEQETKHRAAYERYLMYGEVSELRALQADVDTKGGYWAPRQTSQSLIQAIDDETFFHSEGFATIERLERAVSLGIPSLDTDPSDPDWTSELKTGAVDDEMAFGGRELVPHPLAKRIKVSEKLLTVVPDVVGLVNQRLGHKFAVARENAYLNGNGTGQPLGVFVASDQGIPTSRDVSTGNTATEITVNGILAAKYALKPGYHANAKWIYHRNVLEQIAKIKDGEGRFVWQESLVAGEPDTIRGIPVFMSEFAPSTMTASSYVGVLGDFRYYMIAELMDVSIKRLNELYAEENSVGFIGRHEVDGMPVLAEAFVRVQLGS